MTTTEGCGVAGLGAVGTGLWLINPAVCLIVMGAIIFAIAVLAIRNGDSNDT